MHRRALLILPVLFLLGACTTYEFSLEGIEQPSPSRYGDADPQNFGKDHPAKHEVHGVDVSKWQGDIDWVKLRKSGIDFAYIKSTEGGDHTDDRFDEYWRQARRAGIPRGAYHFYYFCTSAGKQADWFIRNTPKERGALPPVLDIEWNHASPTCKKRPDPAVVRIEMKIFLDRIEAYYGRKPMIYTTVDFHRDNLEGYFGEYTFWVRSVADHPDNIYNGREWDFWQYTGTGRVPGIEGDTDINVFAGDRKDWKAWVSASAL